VIVRKISFEDGDRVLRRPIISYLTSNARSLSCVNLIMIWLFKSLLSLWLIIIEFWSNRNFKNHIIIKVIQERLVELLFIPHVLVIWLTRFLFFFYQNNLFICNSHILYGLFIFLMWNSYITIFPITSHFLLSFRWIRW
jgi:hypothetical protein